MGSLMLGSLLPPLGKCSDQALGWQESSGLRTHNALQTSSG